MFHHNHQIILLEDVYKRQLLSKAENTVDAYESDWDDFVDWCTYQKVSYFPATPETIVNYINDLAD